ncbi:MAG: hypothetical protein KF860_16380 [Cyclobacteriaceae bacterium]|nr:hypothetical protein [Cyclobacteriaceae bacterium]
MTKLFLSIVLILSGLSFTSCLEDKEPEIDPCNDYQWARVDRDGKEMCFPMANILLYFPNSSNSYLQAQFNTPADKSSPSISVYFDIPASGLEVNTTYKATRGDFFGSEEVIDGEIMFISYTTKDAMGHYCESGTFSLTTKNPNSGAITQFTNGKFVSFQPGKNLEDYDACNPF